MNFAIAGFMDPRDGYGYGTLKIVAALHAMTDIASVDFRKPVLYDGVPDQHWYFDMPTVAICTPDWLPFIHTGDHPLIAHTMFEATKLPAGWVKTLNAYATHVVVPCEWNRDVFRDNGVTVPISVAPWGVDQQDYFYMDRRYHVPAAREFTDWPYTFLWSGTPDARKGWDVAYRAFRQAFGDREDVHLVLHFRQLPRGLQGVKDANVELLVGRFFRPRLRQILQDADCFVFPSRGEGWGLPPREAAATGLPVLATNFGGLAHEINGWALPIAVRGMSPAVYGAWNDVGEWAEPSIDETARLMAWCCEHPEDAARFGTCASRWLAGHGTWRRTALAIKAVVDECA